MKKFIQKQLKKISILILKKYQPKIVAISGSLGKTSAKEAIYQVLSSKLNCRSSIKNYNNEIGLPLTIIGEESPGSSFFGWLKLFYKAWRLYFKTDNSYPIILILEMGIDRPGDMKYLTSIVKPDIALMTELSHSHLEYFGTMQNIKKEKQILIESLSSKSLAILNYDNELVKEMAKSSQAEILSYGLKEGADLQAQEINYYGKKSAYQIPGLHFKLNYKGSVLPVELSNILGEAGVYAALAAIAVALEFDLQLIDILESLKEFKLPAGRMQVLAGIKHSFLIDDSYNASPESSLAAIKVLDEIKIDSSASKFAVLGEMLELGAYTETGHNLVGRALADTSINYLISVGERARDIARGAKEAGMSKDNIFHFDDNKSAGLFIQSRLESGDLILIKASRSARIEEISRELMAEPELADQLLVK